MSKVQDQIVCSGGDERNHKRPRLYWTSTSVSSVEGDQFQAKRIWPCVKKSLQYALTGSIVFAIVYSSTATSFLSNSAMVGGQQDVSRTMKTTSAGGYVERVKQPQNRQKNATDRNRMPGEYERSIYSNGNETKTFDGTEPSKKALGKVEEARERREATDETTTGRGAAGATYETTSRTTRGEAYETSSHSTKGAANKTSRQTNSGTTNGVSSHSGMGATNETANLPGKAAFNDAANHTGRGDANDTGKGATKETISQTGRGAIKGGSQYVGGAAKATKNQTSSKSVATNETTNQVETTTSTTKDLKIALYMTTHLSDRHKQFLEKCWPAAVKKLPLLQQVDLIVYTSNLNTTNDKLYYDLGFRNVTIHRYSRLEGFAYQGGAVVAMLDPFLEKHRWFDGYDWVIRTNPDVLIRNDDFLIRTLKNESYDGVFVRWWNNGEPALHTDFFAFRPKEANTTALFKKFSQQISKGAEFVHAETHLYAGFQETVKQGRVAWLPNAKRRKWAARVEGIGCDVFHTHEIVDACPNYFNATDGEFY